MTQQTATLTRGERVILFIERYLRVPEGKLVGRPFRLLPFQKNFILAIYDNPNKTRKAILSIGRKNGKTGLTAAILLAHIVGPEAKLNSQIVSGAMTREQAGIIFSLAHKILDLSPALAGRYKVKAASKVMIGLGKNVEFKALASDGRNVQGLSPVVAILDEVGQVKGPKSDFVDAITTSQGAHDDPLLIMISTQAAEDGDLLSLEIDDAKKKADPTTICHLYTTPEDYELDDPEGWKLSNPALEAFRSKTDVESQAAQALRMPSKENTFRNLTLNQRVDLASPFVTRKVWELGRATPAPLDPHRPVYGGLDLSSRFDLTSLVLLQGSKAEGFDYHSFNFIPSHNLRDREKQDRVPYAAWIKAGHLVEVPGKSIDYDFVIDYIASTMNRLGDNLKAIMFDRWRIEVFEAALERAELQWPMEKIGQGFRDISPALDDLEALLLDGKIRHGLHPLATSHISSARVIQDATGARKLDKRKATGRIDNAVALTMAAAAVTQAELLEDAPPVFDGSEIRML